MARKGREADQNEISVRNGRENEEHHGAIMLAYEGFFWRSFLNGFTIRFTCAYSQKKRFTCATQAFYKQLHA